MSERGTARYLAGGGARPLKSETLEVPDNVRREIERLQKRVKQLEDANRSLIAGGGQRMKAERDEAEQRAEQAEREVKHWRAHCEDDVARAERAESLLNEALEAMERLMAAGSAMYPGSAPLGKPAFDQYREACKALNISTEAWRGWLDAREAAKRIRQQLSPDVRIVPQVYGINPARPS